jgi:hypothetical protein
MTSMEIQLRDKFFAGNLKPSSFAVVRTAIGAIALKRDSVMVECL